MNLKNCEIENLLSYKINSNSGFTQLPIEINAWRFLKTNPKMFKQTVIFTAYYYLYSFILLPIHDMYHQFQIPPRAWGGGVVNVKGQLVKLQKCNWSSPQTQLRHLSCRFSRKPSNGLITGLKMNFSPFLWLRACPWQLTNEVKILSLTQIKRMKCTIFKYFNRNINIFYSFFFNDNCHGEWPNALICSYKKKKKYKNWNSGLALVCNLWLIPTMLSSLESACH